MIGWGVPAGAKMAFHEVTSKPGTPPSATVGTLGRDTERLMLEVPSARSLLSSRLDFMEA